MGFIAPLAFLQALLHFTLLLFGVVCSAISALMLDGGSVGWLRALAESPFFGPLGQALRPSWETAFVHAAVSLSLVLLATFLLFPIFVVLKGAREDRPLPVAAIALLGAAFFIHTFDKLFLGTSSSSPPLNLDNLYYFIIGLNSLTLAAFGAIHLCAIGVSQLFQLPRLACRAPRIGFRSLVEKYWSDDLARLRIELKHFGRALGKLCSRVFVVAAALIGCSAVWSWLAQKLSPTGLAATYFPLFPLLALLLIAATISTYALFTRRGLRQWNFVLLLFILLDALPGTLLDAFGDSVGKIFGTAEITEAGVQRIGTSFVMWTLFVCRGFLLRPVREAFAAARRRLVKTASQVLEISQRRPIVLFRAFADDQSRIVASQNMFVFGFGGKDGTISLEEVIAEALFPRGPVTALANPRAPAPPPLGAVRESRSDADWQDYVINAIQSSQLVAVVVGRTPRLRWEMEQILACGALQRTLFILPPGYPKTCSLTRLAPELAEAVGFRDELEEIRHGGGARMISYDPLCCQWTIFKSMFTSERVYVEATRISASLALSPSR